MTETLTPNRNPNPNPPLIQKQRPPLLSPPNNKFFIGSNDDKLERAQARAARAALFRRKPVTLNNGVESTVKEKCLGKEQIMEMHRKCLKLASENKINQKNTWELDLIDHFSEVIKVDVGDNDTETNFQKASCTLEAGVKIYAMRVDSVHAEAYRVLGGINRVGLDLEQDSVEDGNAASEHVKQTVKKQREQKYSPYLTLESSFDTLNVKKFDVAFSVDPLYHQTSAQFDEGGAKGLLLNNLGVYGGCRVLFDSLEVPRIDKCLAAEYKSVKYKIFSVANDCMEQMVINISKNKEISPTLKDIVTMFDELNRRPPDTFSSAQKSVEPDFEAYDNNNFGDGEQHDHSGTWDFVNGTTNGLTDEGTYDRGDEPFMHNYYEENEDNASGVYDVDDKFIGVDDLMFLKLGLTARQNAWAGPDHWKYQKAKGPKNPANENGSPSLAKKPRNKKQGETDIDFMKALDDDVADPFAPHKNLKSLLLPANIEPCNTTLPEDCHYQPENLVKLFLLPNVMCIGKRATRHSDKLHQEEVNGDFPSWDDDCGAGDQFDDENAYSDVEDSTTLISQPRQVEKIEVQYDRKSKQVDVHVLKETLWSSMLEMHNSAQDENLSFKNMLASFPIDKKKPAAASIDDITPHLCFICLLHLANENGLSIHGSPDLDDLSIHLPPRPNIL
ncbi:condensin complex subunit 2-like protein [Tanacetum coccineum]